MLMRLWLEFDKAIDAFLESEQNVVDERIIKLNFILFARFLHKIYFNDSSTKKQCC